MTFGWVSLALMYLFALFWIASWGDKNTQRAKAMTSHPFIYSMALAIYCTAWTFFGAVGQASRDTWIYLPILLGPMLVYSLGYRFIYKLTLVSKKQHINTIADFIAARYGKRQAVALLVTLIALLATIPYIALQLKAIGSMFQVLTDQQDANMIVLIASISMAAFAIYFGTKHADVTEYRRGLMLAIAFESTVKLLALALVAWMVYRSIGLPKMHEGLAEFIAPSAIEQFSSLSFIAQTIMAAAAVICLPRQFHVAIIDNLNLHHIKTARWLFPSYLLIIAALIPIIAVGGQVVFLNSNVEPDTYVLSLAMYADAAWLQVVVFFGGLSAATAMIIVATLTLSTMLTNDIVLPRLLSLSDGANNQRDYAKRIRLIRRFIIGLILLLSFLYHQQMTSSRSLHSIGLIAFSLVIQLLPAIIGGLYWKRAHAQGVYAGLLVGFVAWVFWLVLPVVNETLSQAQQNALISEGALISLTLNIIAYILFSIFAPTRLIDRMQAEAFVAPAEVRNGIGKKPVTNVFVSDLVTLMSTFMGTGRCEQLLQEYQERQRCTLQHNAPPDQAFMAFCERALGGVIGAASAKALTDSLLRGKKLDFTEVVTFFDDTTQAMQFNMTALLTSLENIDQGISVVDKHLNLVAWNKRYASLYEYPEDLLTIGTPIEKLIRYNAAKGEFGAGDVNDHVEKRLEHLRAGTPHRFTRQRTDGRVIEMVGNPLPGGGFVTSFNDITGYIEIQQALEESNINLEARVKKRTEEVHSINAELRLEIERRSEAEKELIRARKAAEDANASKTRFLALASHDVLQPLNAAKLYISALDEVPLPDAVRSIVIKLNQSVSSSEAMIATLLDIARLDQGELKPSMGAVSVEELITPLVNEMRMRAEEKGIQFTARITSLWVEADKTFLYRIIQNLVSNAVKYTVSGKVLLTVRRVKGQARISVYDTGIGISPAQQSLIFSDFYRTGESEEHGVGLGLGVVRRLSQQMKSTIRVSSVPGRGSCFWLDLPICAPAPQPVSSHPKQYTSFEGLRVMCVDDQRENLDAMRTLLEKWGITVALADNWDEALRQAAQFSPQVLLMDYQLNQYQNGLDLTLAIRQQQGALLPASLLTATQDDAIRQRCAENNLQYMSKPVKPAKLRLMLQNMVTQIRKQAS